MWSPDRPPTRPPRSHHSRSASSLNGAFASPPRYVPNNSAASIDAKSLHSFQDDDSSCDDTYVSMSSKKSHMKQSTPSPQVLKETHRVTNRRSPGLPKSSYRQISRSESSGILDKLKSDINSLDIMRNSSYVDERSVFSGSVFDFDDENKSLASCKPPNVIERSRSVDRSFRGEELRGPLVVDAFKHSGGSVDGRRFEKRDYASGDAASVGSRRTMDMRHKEIRGRLRMEKEEMETKSIREQLRKEKEEMETRSVMGRETANNVSHLEMEMSQKDKKISKLNDTIRGLKREVIMEKDENERCNKNIDELKRKLEECRAKEVDTQDALREVMKNVEHERKVREKEMQLASKVQGAEVLMLEEKLEELQKEGKAKRDTLQDEITEKSRIIDGLKREINQLRSKLDDATRNKADSDKTLRSQIERLELRLDNETEAHNKKVAELNAMHQSAEEEWKVKIQVLEARLDEHTSREAQWTDEISVTRLELENLRLFSAALEDENAYLKKSTEDLHNLERDYDDLKNYKAESDQTIDDLRKELEVAHKAKASLARQIETTKKSEREREEYVSNMESSMKELSGEKKSATAKVEKLQEELAQSKHECESNKAALAKSNEAIADLNNQVQNATAKFEHTLNEGRALAMRVSELESENSKLTGEATSISTKMQHELEAYNGEMANKERQLQAMSQTSNDLKKMISDMQREIGLYKDKLNKMPQLEATIKDLTASLVQSEDKYSMLQSKLKAANSKIDESEQNYDQLDKKFRALQREQSEMEERERSYASNVSKRERDQIDTIQTLKKEKIEQVLRIEQLLEDVTKAKREVAQTKDEAKKSKDQLRTALQSLDEMMKYIDGMKEESDEMIKALEGETEGLMKRIGVLEKHREFDQQTIKLYENEKNEKAQQIRSECQREANDELRKLRSDHEKEIADVRSRYECRIKELQSTIAQRSEITRSLQEHGSTEVTTLIKKLGEITEKHSQDLRSLREKYEAELTEESNAKNSLKATLREMVSKNEDLEEALRLAEAKPAKSDICEKCDSISKILKEKEETCAELRSKLQEQSKTESKLRGELAQNKQLMSITQANEKLLEDHVQSLETQIDTLVADYESKLN